MKKYHYDDEFEGKRLADDLTALETSKNRKILMYSPKLRANILVFSNRLKLYPNCSETVEVIKVTNTEKKWILKMFNKLELGGKDALKGFLVSPKEKTQWISQGDGEGYEILSVLLRVKRGDLKL
jgi:hypothetical protein